MRLVPAGQVAPSTYNPRVADPKRLDMIALSLRKLGFLLPLYATPQGEILSGHQRHYVAVEMLGWEHVPVEETPAMELAMRKATNLLFNRATNDMGRADQSQALRDRLAAVDVLALAAQMPDKEGDGRFPCLSATGVSVQALVKANSGRWNQYTYNVSKALARKKIVMPLVVKAGDLRVVNGIGRLQWYAAEKLASAPAVLLSDEEAALADAMMNLLTMDFNIHERYADVLRYNSFRRTRGRRPFGVGVGMTWPLGVKAHEFDVHNSNHVAAWKAKFGEVVLDFGGGQREDSDALRFVGVTADDFEPYPLKPGTEEIDPELARRMGRDFLAKVAAGRQWTSIFMSAVLNSVPFHDDRRKIIAIVAALCGPGTTFYTYSSATDRANVSAAKGKGEYLHRQQDMSLGFQLDYEPNVVLGEYGTRPKVQKYFEQAEFEALMRERFAEVGRGNGQKAGNGGVVYAVCRGARPLDLRFLAEALAFEFDLPYPDGSRLGLADEALAAFGARLGVML